MKSDVSPQTNSLAVAGLVGAIFFVGLLTPRGVAEWLLYAVPLVLTPWAQPRISPFVLATVCNRFDDPGRGLFPIGC